MGKLRAVLEKHEQLSGIRDPGRMPRGTFIAHMTIGKPSDSWPTSMGRLQANMARSLGADGGWVVLTVWGRPEVLLARF